jgi:hypothetical protein
MDTGAHLYLASDWVFCTGPFRKGTEALKAVGRPKTEHLGARQKHRQETN